MAKFKEGDICDIVGGAYDGEACQVLLVGAKVYRVRLLYGHDRGKVFVVSQNALQDVVGEGGEEEEDDSGDDDVI